ENVGAAVLRDLRHDVAALAVLRDRDQGRGGGEVAVPNVVLHGLEVPDALAGRGLQAQDRVRVQVVSESVRAVEVVGRRAGPGVDETALDVERESRPRVRATDVFPRILRPGVVAGLARMRDRVERPALAAGVDVEGADVARRRRQSLGDDRAEDQQVFVEDTGRVDADADRAGLAALEAEAQVDAAVLAEVRDRLAGRRVERVEPVLGAEVDAPLVAALPVHEAADPPPAWGLRALERAEAPP